MCIRDRKSLIKTWPTPVIAEKSRSFLVGCAEAAGLRLIFVVKAFHREEGFPGLLFKVM
ncbi:MAG: hypothetical protein LBD55_04635 [Treponema sp.]|jgi:hypothetical protein|nr:hypothetical protein [Treponema sp.]